MPKFVDIESPYKAKTIEVILRNIRYARACSRDCLSRGEIPYASQIYFTQPGILDDNIPEERKKGIKAGKEITKKLDATTVVYEDLGISEGMKFGIKEAKDSGREVEYRKLGENWEEEFTAHEVMHSDFGIW